jgi:hypothetical protein
MRVQNSDLILVTKLLVTCWVRHINVLCAGMPQLMCALTSQTILSILV